MLAVAESPLWNLMLHLFTRLDVHVPFQSSMVFLERSLLRALPVVRTRGAPSPYSLLSDVRVL